MNVDRNADDAPGDTFIATDNATSAYEVCKYIIGKAGNKGQMIMVHGQKGTTPRSSVPGLHEGHRRKPGVKLVAEQWSEQWSQAEGLNITQNLLQANPDVSIVFAQADGLALGAAQAVKVSGAQGVIVGGFDGDTTALPILAGRFRRHRDPAGARHRPSGRGQRHRWPQARRCRPSNCCPAFLTTPENAPEFVANHP